ncbi:MAG TPA: hypothetical protein VFK89_02520 [Actinomycetota bacterium]|nr:hypothetical protein [Actinomycetota bacterium]
MGRDEMRYRKTLAALLIGLLAVLVAAPAVTAAPKYVSKNLKLVTNIRIPGGTELAAQGKYLYAGQMDGGAEPPGRGTKPDQGGIHIIDVSGRTPKEVGFLHCAGDDNDVEVVKPGLLAVAHHTSKCNMVGNGMYLVDVSNPRKPRVTGTIAVPSGHTLKPYPGTPYVYVSPGGLANGAGVEHIIDVSDPHNPKDVAQFKPNPTGCHDLSFYIAKDKKLAFCSGLGETQIWDVSDPLAPVTISHIANPLIEFEHYPVASSDGKYLAIDDEAFALHECKSHQTPTGRVWIYDISNPQVPLPVGSYAAPRGGDSTGIGTDTGWIPTWCLSHGLDWLPGTHKLAVTWFTGGVSVLDLDAQGLPEEIAYFQAPDSATYSALWHDGRLYTNDSIRGVDAFEFDPGK